MSNNSSSSRNFIPMANKYDRVVLLVDMDCFYCQVEEKLDPSLNGQPLAVVQYNAWRGGGIIAVNYAARAKGVTRHMRGDEAKAQCPNIQLIKVPNVREKADLTKYREAGKDVANVLQRFTPLLERASVDEAYLDITELVKKRLIDMNEGTFVLQPSELVSTYAVGFDTIGEFVTTITINYTNPLLVHDDIYRNFQESDIPAVRNSNIRLLIGASIASEIRAAVKAETTYECSAGIAHNKILAKLACGMNKPNKQTLLPLCQITGLFETLPVGKIKGLGAKFGEDICERLGIRYLGQMLKFTEVELQRKFDEKNGSWLYNICRGIDLEAITVRFYSKSIGCCKKFPGRNNITGLKTLQHWLKELANEINDRLDKDIAENNRRAKQMVVNFIQEINSEEISSSRSAPLNCYDTEILARAGLEIIKTNTKQFFRTGSESVLHNPIKFLGISVGKFETISNSQTNIQEMFAQQSARSKKPSVDDQFKIIEQSSTIAGSSSSSSTHARLEADEIQKQASDKKERDVKSLFANALKKQEAQTSKEHSCVDNVKKPIAIDRLSKVPQSSPKSFFKKRLKKVTQQEPNETAHNRNEDTDVIELHSLNKADQRLPSLDINETTTVLNTTQNMQVSPTIAFVCEKAPANTYQNDGNELEDLINDLENIQNDSDNAKECDSVRHMQTDLTFPGPNGKRKFSDISEKEHSQIDYKAEYAEFAIPEWRPELVKFTSCTKCSAKIPSDPQSLQTHQDHHFAQELSQTQRVEFREQVRSKINKTSSSPNNGNKKLKKSPTNIKKPLNESITRFLKPTSASVVANELQVTETDGVTCEICKVPIKLEEVSEHKDFHVAKDLQRKLNLLEVHTVEVAKKSIPETSGRNLNSSLIATSRQSMRNVKPITKFFTQSNT